MRNRNGLRLKCRVSLMIVFFFLVMWLRSTSSCALQNCSVDSAAINIPFRHSTSCSMACSLMKEFLKMTSRLWLELIMTAPDFNTHSFLLYLGSHSCCLCRFRNSSSYYRKWQEPYRPAGGTVLFFWLSSYVIVSTGSKGRVYLTWMSAGSLSLFLLFPLSPKIKTILQSI